MTSPDGASHWGPRPESPFAMVNSRLSRQRAPQQREGRRRSADERDAYAPGPFSDEEDEYTTPLSRRTDQHEWYTQRWGDLRDHIGEDWSREEFVESGYTWRRTEAEHTTGTCTMPRTGAHPAPTLSRTGAHRAPMRRRPRKDSPPRTCRSRWEHTEISRSKCAQDRWRHRVAT